MLGPTLTALNFEDTSAWARNLIEKAAEEAASSVRKFCKRPGSAKRLHRARKTLARLLATLGDLAAIADGDGRYVDRVHELHRRAGKVRDADVLRKRIKAYRKEAKGADRGELDAVDRKLRKKRKKARRRLQTLINELPALRA